MEIMNGQCSASASGKLSDAINSSLRHLTKLRRHACAWADSM